MRSTGVWAIPDGQRSKSGWSLLVEHALSPGDRDGDSRDHPPAPEKGSRMPVTATSPPDRGALSGLLTGVSFIAGVAGGGLAAASLATSAVTHAMLTGQHDDDDAAKLARREFVAGGVVHGVGFGVLTGALALAGLRTGELPRPVAITGLVSAASSLLSPLYFLWEPAGWLIPAGRFPGLVVSGIAGVRLARGARPLQQAADLAFRRGHT